MSNNEELMQKIKELENIIAKLKQNIDELKIENVFCMVCIEKGFYYRTNNKMVII